MSVGTATITPEQFETVTELTDDIDDQIDDLADRFERAHDQAMAAGDRDKAEALAGMRHQLDDLAEEVADIEAMVTEARQRVEKRASGLSYHDYLVANGEDLPPTRGGSNLPSYREAVEQSLVSADDVLDDLRTLLEDR